MAVAVAACGSSSATPPSTSTTGPAVPSGALLRVRASVAATTAADTAHFQSVSTTGAGSGAHPTVVTMTGSISFHGPDVSSTNTISVPAGPSSKASTLQQGDALYFGATGTVYLSASGPGGPWQKGSADTSFSYLAPVTPRALQDAAGPVTVLGPAVIGGVATIGYAVPIAAQVQKTSTTGTPVYLHIAPFTARVWLDAEGRIVRTSGTIRGTVVPGHSSLTETDTTTLSDFGTPVSITPPATATPA